MKWIIYLLTNSDNGKIYIGQTNRSPKERMGNNGIGYLNCRYLYNAILSYGMDKFHYTVLDTCEDIDTANILEAIYITKYNSRDPNIGYNLKEGGGSIGQHAISSRQKMSASQTGENNPMFGKQQSDETKQAISKANTGRTRSDYVKEVLSNIMLERHANNPHPMLGKEHTEEARIAIGNTVRGAKRDPAIVAQGAAKRRIPADEVNEMTSAYVKARDEAEKNNTKLDAKKIATEFGTNTTTMYRKLKENGVRLFNRTLSAAKTGKPQNKPIVLKPPIPTTIPGLTRDQTIIAAYQNEDNNKYTYTIKDIEAAFTITAPTIYDIMKRNDIPLRTK